MMEEENILFDTAEDLDELPEDPDAELRDWMLWKRDLEKHMFIHFFLSFLLPCGVLSFFVVLLIERNILSQSDLSCLVLSIVSFIVYAAIVIWNCLRLHSLERNATLYFKTALPAYGLFILITTLGMCLCTEITVWFVFPLRFLRMAGSTNLLSFTVAHAIMLLLIVGAFAYDRKFGPKEDELTAAEEADIYL